MKKKIIKVLKKPQLILLHLINNGWFNFLDDKTYLKLKFKYTMNKKLNLENPETFSEKLQWLKLNDRKDIYTTIVDKQEVKKYIADYIGEEYIIPTLGVYNNFDDIDFDKLPDQFVIKCTHDSGGIVICKDKKQLDMKAARKKINKSLKRKYYYLGREWPYKNVKPRIIVEKYMKEAESQELNDYKFMCFHGKVKYILCCTDRQSSEGLKLTFFDHNWNQMPFGRVNQSIAKKTVKKPYNLKKMIELAEKLSKDFPFIRVDFYESNKKIYFGELTFYPGSGFKKFTPEEWDYKLGNLINLKKENN